jgi:hypothetical protein
MANTIKSTNLKASTFVDSTSRYLNSPVIYYGGNNIITFETYVRKPPAFTAQDKYMLINKGQEYRPDLVSYRAYGDVGFWWKIMEANQIYDIWDFKAGVNIRIPAAIG